MKTSIFILLISSALNAVGQTQFVGVKPVINWTNISGDLVEKPEFRTGFSAGVFYQYFLKPNLHVTTEINYSERGFKHDLNLRSEVNEHLGKTKISFNYAYLSLPLKVGFNTGNKLYATASIGVVPAWILEAKQIISAIEFTGGSIDFEPIDQTGSVTKFDLAGIIEVGGGYKLTDRHEMFAAMAYQHSISTVSNSGYFSGSEMRHYGIALSLGLKYALGTSSE